MIRGRYVLQLDDEKMIYGVKKKIISWQEIKEIKPSLGSFTRIKLVLYNNKKLNIDASEIKGDDDEIYQSILRYFTTRTDLKI